MHRKSISTDYRNYPYVPPIYTPPSRPSRQNYDPIQHTEQVLYSHSTLSSADSQRQIQPLPAIPDASDPLTVFDDRQPRARLRSNTSSLSSGYIPPNPLQRSSVSDARLATANAMRERLLTDIQDNIMEIERELSTLEVRPTIANYIPSHYSATSQKSVQPKRSHHHICKNCQTSIDERSDSSIEEEESEKRRKSKKKVYEVIPKTASPAEKTLKRSTTKLIEPQAYIGQYHYGAEIGESEITGDAPENVTFESIIEQIPEFKYEALSTEQFLHTQPPLPLNRALIFAVMYGDKENVGDNEVADDFRRKKPTTTKAEELLVAPLSDIESADKITTQNFEALIKTAPEPPNIGEPPDPSELNEDEIMRTMFSKPLKHNRLSTRTSESLSGAQAGHKSSDKNGPNGKGYFFSDFGNEGDVEGEEDLISLDLSNFAVPVSSEMVSDENALGRPFATSLQNPHGNQQTIQNEHDRGAEKKKHGADNTDNLNNSSTQQMLSNSATDISKGQSTKPNEYGLNNRRVSRKMSTVNTTAPLPKSTKSSFHFDSSLIALEHKELTKPPANPPEKRPVSGSKQSRLVRQRSSSLRQDSKIPQPSTVARQQSILSPEANTRQGKPGARRTSVLPVPLNQLERPKDRISTSRSTTPERRNSIPVLDQNVLFSLLDMVDLDEPSVIIEIDSKPNEESSHDTLRDQTLSMNEEEDARWKAISSVVIQSDHSLHEDLYLPDLFDTNIVSTEDKDTYQGSTTSVSTTNQLNYKNHSSHLHTNDLTSMENHQSSEQQFCVVFCNNLSHLPVNQIPNWSDRLSTFTTDKKLLSDKYAFLRQNVNLSDASDYLTDKIEKSTDTQVVSEQVPSMLLGQRRSSLHDKSQSYSFDQSNSQICYTNPKWHSVSNLSKTTSGQQTNTLYDLSDINSRQQDCEIPHPTARRYTEPDVRGAFLSNENLRRKLTSSSELDRRQGTEEKTCSSEQYDGFESNTLTDITLSDYSTIFLTQNSKLNKENFNDKYSAEFRRVNTPPNRPKWNSVSKTRSVNFIYNPKVPNSNSIRKGWDYELRRKRVHKLPPLEHSRDQHEHSQLAIEAPPFNGRLAIDYNYDNSVHERSNRTTPSSRQLVSINRFAELQLVSESPRSQRPVHQEWYNDMNRSQRTDMEQTTNASTRQKSTSREFVPLHPLNHNSLHNGTLLDPSIRTNRATELRLSRDMDEHHHHAHDVNQSMPFEIRGFQVKGMQLTTPDDAKIRPLLNVNYRASERVKTRRIYPLGHPFQENLAGRRNSLLPIEEFRQSSFSTSIVDLPQSVHEE
ncbi:unnamed protein product [Adineta ricciae]|uniref:Uncharacterized protein n=1 Tax=Adineta ricciae TaxID=249248 RepID=A0A815Q9H6_ADIRI|nr:unnamed protein product [Adineta ricciae]